MSALVQIYRWPLLLAIASSIGLAAALVGDGFYDAVSWACLGGVVLVVVVAYYRGQ
jgi:hypothetical protein